LSVAAVCFDLDGTLIRSEEMRDAVRRAYVRESGGTWTSEAERDMVGMHLAEWAHYMHDRLGVSRAPVRIAREIEARIEAIYRDGIPLAAGALDALARCAAVWPLALATGSTRRLIELVLELGNLGSFFTVTVSVDDVGRGKPAPDVYLRAATLLGVDPRACVAIEDSASGIRSARDAGMRTIALLDPAYGIDRAERSTADATIASLVELTPEVIRAAARR
jgi:beta-phosphoglucomutase-like phosphatase (HAD superfamily)